MDYTNTSTLEIVLNRSDPRATLKPKYLYTHSDLPYQRKFELTNQLSYLETKYTKLYFPRDVIETELVSELNVSKSTKPYQNTLTILSPTPELSILISYSKIDNELQLYTFNFQSLNEKQPTMEFKNKYVFPVTKNRTGVYHIFKSTEDSFVLRFHDAIAKYKIKFEEDAQTPSISLEECYYIKVDGKLLQGSNSQIQECCEYFLTSAGIVYKKDSSKIDAFHLFQGKTDTNYSMLKNFKYMDSSSHPSCVFIGNDQSLYYQDLREQPLINSLLKINQNSIFDYLYGIKQIKNQFFMTCSKEFLNFFDIRYTSKPLFKINHYCDALPPNCFERVCDFSNQEKSIEELVAQITLESLQQKPIAESLLLFNTQKEGYAAIIGPKYSLMLNELEDKYLYADTFAGIIQNLTHLRNVRTGEVMLEPIERITVQKLSNSLNRLQKITGAACLVDSKNSSIYYFQQTNDQELIIKNYKINPSSEVFDCCSFNASGIEKVCTKPSQLDQFEEFARLKYVDPSSAKVGQSDKIDIPKHLKESTLEGEMQVEDEEEDFTQDLLDQQEIINRNWVEHITKVKLRPLLEALHSKSEKEFEKSFREILNSNTSTSEHAGRYNKLFGAPDEQESNLMMPFMLEEPDEIDYLNKYMNADFSFDPKKAETFRVDDNVIKYLNKEWDSM